MTKTTCNKYLQLMAAATICYKKKEKRIQNILSTFSANFCHSKQREEKKCDRQTRMWKIIANDNLTGRKSFFSFFLLNSDSSLFYHFSFFFLHCQLEQQFFIHSFVQYVQLTSWSVYWPRPCQSHAISQTVVGHNAFTSVKFSSLVRLYATSLKYNFNATDIVSAYVCLSVSIFYLFYNKCFSVFSVCSPFAVLSFQVKKNYTIFVYIFCCIFLVQSRLVGNQLQQIQICGSITDQTKNNKKKRETQTVKNAVYFKVINHHWFSLLNSFKVQAIGSNEKTVLFVEHLVSLFTLVQLW